MQICQFFSRRYLEDMIRREFNLPDRAEIEWHSDGGGAAIWSDELNRPTLDDARGVLKP